MCCQPHRLWRSVEAWIPPVAYSRSIVQMSGGSSLCVAGWVPGKHKVRCTGLQNGGHHFRRGLAQPHETEKTRPTLLCSQGSETVYAKQCASQPGFSMSFADPSAQRTSFYDYRRLCAKWQHNITAGLRAALQSRNYVQTRNAFLILNTTVKVGALQGRAGSDAGRSRCGRSISPHPCMTTSPNFLCV